MGSVYDYSRKECILSNQWLLRFFDVKVGIKTPNTITIGSEITVEAWLYPEVLSEDSYFSLYKQGGTIDFVFSKKTFKGGMSDGNVLPKEISLFEWTHLAISAAGDDYTMCKDELCKDGKLSNSIQTASGDGILLGTVPTGDPFIGYATEFRIWNTRRTGDAIKANLYRRLQSENGLVIVLGFNEGPNTALHPSNGFYNSLGDENWVAEIEPPPLCEGGCYFDGINCRCNS